HYGFYDELGRVLGFDAVDTLLAPGGAASLSPRPKQLSKDGNVDMGEPDVTKTGLTSASKAINDYIDVCADSKDLTPTSCPFGASRDLASFLGYDGYFDYEDIKWKVKKYPEIELTADDGGFAVSEVKAGEVDIAATGIEGTYNEDAEDFEPSGKREIKVSCGVDLRSMLVRLTADGDWKASHHRAGDIHDDASTFRPAVEVDTCQR
ncbi:MAG: hypothetical protein ACRD0P_21550, partial [Stackebrandtia sp.]